MAMKFIKVNGERREFDAELDTPLLYVLRNDLELNAPRFGCGLAQCGVCSVLLNGRAIRSCVVPVGSVLAENDFEITTLEGLGSEEKPHPLQQAFIDEQAVQCGYCVNGQLIGAADLLAINPDPSEEEIKSHMTPYLCRCGTHFRVVKAIKQAAAKINEGEA